MLFIIKYNFDIPCFYKKYLGIECPWCGCQRALKLLLDGKILDSFFVYIYVHTHFFQNKEWQQNFGVTFCFKCRHYNS